jgi:hypothetical protein
VKDAAKGTAGAVKDVANGVKDAFSPSSGEGASGNRLARFKDRMTKRTVLEEQEESHYFFEESMSVIHVSMADETDEADEATPVSSAEDSATVAPEPTVELTTEVTTASTTETTIEITTNTAAADSTTEFAKELIVAEATTNTDPGPGPDPEPPTTTKKKIQNATKALVVSPMKKIGKGIAKKISQRPPDTAGADHVHDSLTDRSIQGSLLSDSSMPSGVQSVGVVSAVDSVYNAFSEMQIAPRLMPINKNT